MTVPNGYVEVAGVFVPEDLAPTVMTAIRAIYADQVAGMDDASAVAQVSKSVMADLLERNAVWAGTVAMQTEIGRLQDQLATAQATHRDAIETARLAARAQAVRLLGPEDPVPS